MAMYDEAGVLLTDHTSLVAVNADRTGHELSGRPTWVHRGGSLMCEMHWDELPMVGYVVMKFQDFTRRSSKGGGKGGGVGRP